MRKNKRYNKIETCDEIQKEINKIERTKTPIYIAFISGIFSIIFSLIGYYQTDLSLSKNQTINNIAGDSEDSENYSTIISDYYQIVNMYRESILEKKDTNVDNKELKELENQIDKLTTDISNINDKIIEIESSIEYNNNHDIISSSITGICTIIAALIAGVVTIKVAKMKLEEKK